MILKMLAILSVPLGPALFIVLIYLLAHATPTGRRMIGKWVLSLIGAVTLIAILGACDRTTETPAPRQRVIETVTPRPTSDWIKR